jgi:hypothetical protein
VLTKLSVVAAAVITLAWRRYENSNDWRERTGLELRGRAECAKITEISVGDELQPRARHIAIKVGLPMIGWVRGEAVAHVAAGI